jgi:hypothetical protein
MRALRLTPFFFDYQYLDGVAIDEPLERRVAALAEAAQP